MSIEILTQNNIIEFSKKTTAAILGMVLLPIFIHLIPFNGVAPLGAFLLPMFIASLVAAFYLPPVGLVIAAMLAPMINHILTGMPTADLLPVLISELMLFSLLVWWFVQKRLLVIGGSVLIAIFSKWFLWQVTWILGSNILFSFFLQGILRAVPGLIILGLTELILHRKIYG